MSELEMLTEMLAYWQPRLRLSDWAVKLEMVRMSDIEGSLARNTTYLSSKSALLRVSTMDSRYSSGPAIGAYDQEEDLVHELVHLHFDTLNRCVSTSDEVLEKIGLEQPVDILSLALVRLRRETGHKFSWEERS